MDDEKVEFTRPQHPLPDEINKMTLDETVCKYCGISYLIHREVARLQDQVHRLNAELTASKSERENAQKLVADNKQLESENGQLQNDIQIYQTKLTTLSQNVTKLEKENADIIKGKTRAQIIQRERLNKQREATVQFISECRQQLDDHRKETTQAIKNIDHCNRSVIAQISDHFQSETLNLVRNHEQQLIDYEETFNDKITKAQLQLNSVIADKNDEIATLETRIISDNSVSDENLNLQKTISSLRVELEQSLKSKNEVMSQIGDQNSKLMQLEIEIDTTKDINKQLSKDFQEVTRANANYNVENHKLKRRTTEDSKIWIVEGDHYKSKIFDLENELKNLQFELLSKEELLRNSVTMEDVREIKNQNDIITNLNKGFQNDIEALTDRLSQSRSEHESCQKEHTAMVIQVRMELERKISMLEHEKDDLVRNTSSYDKIIELEDEVNIEKEKARTAMELARIEINSAEDQFQSLLAEKDEEIMKSRSLAQQNEDSQDKSIGGLRAQISELSIQNQNLHHQLDATNEKINVIQIKNEEKNVDLIDENGLLKTQALDLNEKVLSLSETIRKQIEERMEIQNVLRSLRNPKDEKEVIILPITNRLKAASLPPIEVRPPVAKRAWGSNAASSYGAEPVDARKTSSAPMIKQKQKASTAANNLTMSSIRKRLNLALNRGQH